MTCVTQEARNRHTTRHHQRESSALESAGRIATRILCTRRVRREGTPSLTTGDRAGPEGDLMELNGWSSPQMLRRYGASARSARARRTYDRIMDESP